MASGMAGLYIGASGLHAAQTALNTTGHNLSNISTEGYTRQQIVYETSPYQTLSYRATGSLRYGIGVDIQDVRRVRNEFLDKAYRQENGRAAFYEAQYTAIEEVEALFGELEGVKFEDSINDLWSAMNELAKNPGSTVTRTALVQSSVAFINRATAIYDGLVSYQKMLNTKVVDTVNRINEIGVKINDLNKKINYIESSNENANDYRDERDALLDELASLVKIEYWETADKKINIHIENSQFLTGNSFFPMAVEEIGTTGLFEPVWPLLGNRSVFATNEEFNSINNNDMGELKGIILARGNDKVNYTDVPVEPEREDFATEEEYQAAYKEFRREANYYNNNVDNSVILSTMAGLDKLVNGIVEAVNDVLCPETTSTENIVATDGTVIPAGSTILDMEKTSFGMDGKSAGVELFARKYTDRYIEKEYIDANGNTQKIYVRNDKNVSDLDSLYTLGNLVVNDKVLQDYQNIPLSLNDGSEDFAKAEQLLDIWEVKFAALNPDKYAKEDYQSFYKSLIGASANRGEALHNMQRYQESMANEINNKRQESIGVSSDEELTNMIKFQNAYNAASRYINVVSEMMEHLVTALGS